MLSKKKIETFINTLLLFKLVEFRNLSFLMGSFFHYDF